MAQLNEVVIGELLAVAERAPYADELQRSKAQLKAGLLMSLESASARSEQLARQLMIFDRLMDARELTAKVDAVTGSAVRDVASRIIGARPATVVVVGAGKRSAGYAEKTARAVAV